MSDHPFEVRVSPDHRHVAIHQPHDDHWIIPARGDADQTVSTDFLDDAEWGRYTPATTGTLTAGWDGTVERDDRGDTYVGCTAWTGRPVLLGLTTKQAGELGRSLVDAPPARRHMPGVVLGLALLGLFGLLTYTAWTAGGWWILAAGPTALMAALGAYGITSDAQRVPRDGRGRRLR